MNIDEVGQDREPREEGLCDMDMLDDGENVSGEHCELLTGWVKVWGPTTRASHRQEDESGEHSEVLSGWVKVGPELVPKEREPREGGM